MREVYRLEGVSGKDVRSHPECERMRADVKRGRTGPGSTRCREDVEAWPTSVANDGALTKHDVPGVGAYYGVHGPRIAGGTVVRYGHAVHTALFPAVH